MGNDSVEHPAGQDCKGPTLDTWSWILRARDAARRAVEPSPRPPEPSGEAATELQGRPVD